MITLLCVLMADLRLPEVRLPAPPVLIQEMPVPTRDELERDLGFPIKDERLPKISDKLRRQIRAVWRMYGPKELRAQSNLALAQILAESRGKADAVSPVGARGLGQIMPATARGYGVEVDQLFDPGVNLLVWAKHMRFLHGFVNSSRRLANPEPHPHNLHLWSWMLVGYNAGHSISLKSNRGREQGVGRLVRLGRPIDSRGLYEVLPFIRKDTYHEPRGYLARIYGYWLGI